jgi:hypothetical protein
MVDVRGLTLRILGPRCAATLRLSEIDFLDDMCPSHGSVVVKDKFDWLMNHQQHYLDGLRSFGCVFC